MPAAAVAGGAVLLVPKETNLRIRGFMRKYISAPALACLFAGGLAAQDTTELLNRMRAMEDRIKALEAEVQSLKGQPAAAAAVQQPAVPQPAVPEPAATPPGPAPQDLAGQPRLGGAGGAAAKVLNPDISVIGDFVGGAGNAANRPTPSLEMHESEVGFQEVIDPYARADFFISFGEHGVDLEEGFLTFTSLPAGLQLKVGKMRAAFGKVNTLHNHVLPWTDRPLVSQNLIGGEEGLNDAGLSLSRILPAPGGLFMEGTAQVYRGDSEGIFQARKRSDLSTVGHLRIYKDINDSTNVDVGGSFARGRSPFGPEGWNQLYGFDGTLRWKPLQRSIYQSFVGRAELVWARTRVGPSHSNAIWLLRIRRLSIAAPLVPRWALRPVAARCRAADVPGNDHHLRPHPDWCSAAARHRRLHPPDLLAE